MSNVEFVIKTFLDGCQFLSENVQPTIITKILMDVKNVLFTYELSFDIDNAKFYDALDDLKHSIKKKYYIFKDENIYLDLELSSIRYNGSNDYISINIDSILTSVNKCV